MPSVLLLAVVLSYVLGFLCVAVLIAWLQAGQLWRTKEPQWLQLSSLKVRPAKGGKLDSRLTGSGHIDQELQKVLMFGLRDFVQSWYHRYLSADWQFGRWVAVHSCPQCHSCGRATYNQHWVHCCRCKETDVVTYCSQTLVEDCLGHLRLYKAAAAASSDKEAVEHVFVEEPPNEPWGQICTNLQATQAYLQSVTEVLLLLLLPQDEYQNAVLRQLTRDILVWRVWMPMLQVITQPDFINSLIISLCKDTSLNAESFMAGIAGGSTQLEREELLNRISAELDRLKQVGVTASDQQKMAALVALQEALNNQGESPAVEPEEECPLSVSTTIPKFSIVTDGSGKKSVLYHIHVACRHSNAPVVEQWRTARTYTDFHDLHITLRSLVGSLPGDLNLPSQRSLNKLDPQFIDSRRARLQHYLDIATSEEFFTAHPPAVAQLILFLTGDVYKHSSGELSRIVDSLVSPFRPLRRGTSKLQELVKTPSSSPNPTKKLRVLPDARAGSNEEEEGEFVHVLLVLFDEVFDVPGGGQWLRRQVTTLVSQLIGDKITRKAIETLHWLTSPEQIAEYMRDLRNTVWPDGYRASPLPEMDYEGDKICRAALARAKLIGSAPEDLRRLIGTDTTTAGIARLFQMFQSEAVNRRLAFVLMEGLLDTMFPQRNLKEAFRCIRVSISKLY